MSNTKIKAIIWDYDGTLVDTQHKNFTDVQCVRAANRTLQEENANVQIFSIGACYDSGPNTSTWNFRPDYEAQEVEEILHIVDHIGRSLT